MAESEGTTRRRQRPSPNEHILQYLRESKDEASVNMSYAINRALKNVEKEQLELKTFDDLIAINGIGSHLANRIIAHLSKHSEEPTADPPPKEPVENPPKMRRKKPYVPAPRSAPYALLLALLDSENEELPHLGRLDLAERAQKYADEPIIQKKGSGRGGPKYGYDGWSSMGKTLIAKALVVKKSSPAQYSLTEAGREVAEKCAEIERQNNIVTQYNPDGSANAPSRSNTGGGKTTNAVPNSSAGASSSAPVVNFSMMAANVMADLRVGGHEPDLLRAALNRVISSGNIPNNDLEMRVALLGQLEPQNKSPSNDPPENANQSAAGGGASSDLGPSAELVEDSGEFILILDKREKLQRQGQSCEKFAEAIRKDGVPTEIRTLPVGDAIFIRKCRRTGKEEVLNFIVERKTANDFESSVCDGRIFRQAYSMLNSKISRRVVVLEGLFKANDENERMIERLEKTVSELEVFHDIQVKRTKDTKETIGFYRDVHRLLSRAPVERHGEQLVFDSWVAELEELNKAWTVEQLFYHQLLNVPGIGKKSAESVMKLGFSSLHDLKELFSKLSAEEGPLYLTKQAKEKGLDTIRKSCSQALYNLFRLDPYP